MLLFLDFDGVTHPLAGAESFDTRCMGHLVGALAPYPAVEIVVRCSPWRFLVLSNSGRLLRCIVFVYMEEVPHDDSSQA